MTRFEAALKKLIGAEIETLKEELALGLSITDHAKYLGVVGKISGLRITLDLCETANAEIEKH